VGAIKASRIRVQEGNVHGMRNFAEARVALYAYVSSRPSERTYTFCTCRRLFEAALKAWA